MKKLNKIGLMTLRFWMPILVVLLFALPVHAMTYFYLDPDWTGSTTGASSTPWTSLDSSAWATINEALVNDDVTIYFSAREADEDIEELYGAPDEIDFTGRRTEFGHTLTLNGRSKYNSNNASPSWHNYSGDKKCKIEAIKTSGLDHVAHNKTIIDGFKCEIYDTKFTICGSDFTVQNCDIYTKTGGTATPLLLVQATANGAHGGSNNYCPPCDNINILDNVIHESHGELLYVGGGGIEPGTGETWADCGYPSHTNITIRGNILYNGGVRGGEGDGIDLKAGLRDVFISQNEIYGLNSGIAVKAIKITGYQDDDPRDQNILIERNYIHDCTSIYAAISVTSTHGTPQGIRIHNNIIDSVSNSVGDCAGIRTEDNNGDIHVYNNSIYNVSGVGIWTAKIVSGTVTVRNNLLINNNSGGKQVAWSGQIVQSNNAYSHVFGETCTDCQAGMSITDFQDASGGDFSLASGSNAIDNGFDLGSACNWDYLGTPRPNGSGWEIGAYEYGLSDNPSPPQKLQIVQEN